MKIGTGGVAGIWAGLPKDNLREIKSVAAQAIKNGTLKPAKASDLAVLKKVLTQSTPPPKLVNVTPKHELGVGYRAVGELVNGKVFVQSQVVSPNAKPKWFVAGTIIH